MEHRIDSGDANTAGAMVYGCRQPVNDIYGDESSQNVEPYTYYAPSKVLGSVGVTTKLSEEETIAFLQFVDFMFTEEGAQLALGLSKEQYEACKDEFYTANGLTEGGYKKEGDTYVYNVDASNPISNAMALARVVTRKALPLDKKYDPSVAQAVAQWDYYEVAPTLFAASVSNALSTEEGSEVTNIRNNVDQFMIRSISSIIMGKGYDVWDDAAWEQFCTDINKFQPERVTEIYNEKLQLLEQ